MGLLRVLQDNYGVILRYIVDDEAGAENSHSANFYSSQKN